MLEDDLAGAPTSDHQPPTFLHHPPRAKRVIQLFMAGAASHVDLFDYKPELVKQHGEPCDFGEQVEAFQNGLGPWLKPSGTSSSTAKCGKQLANRRAARARRR